MIVCIPVSDGQVAQGWGRTRRLALSRVVEGAIVDWQELDVGWDAAHDIGPEGSHHARVARFLREQRVEVVAVEHMGEPMQRMISKLGIRVVSEAQGDARAAVLAAAEVAAP